MSDLEGELSTQQKSKEVKFKKRVPVTQKLGTRRLQLDFDEEETDLSGIKAAPRTSKFGPKSGKTANASVAIPGEERLKQGFLKSLLLDTPESPKEASRSEHSNHERNKQSIDPLTGMPFDPSAVQEEAKTPLAASNIHSIHLHNSRSDQFHGSNEDDEDIEEGKNELIMTLDDAFVDDEPLGLSGEQAFSIDANMYDLELGSPETHEDVSTIPGTTSTQKATLIDQKPADLQLQIADLKRSIANLKVDQTQAEQEYSEVKAQLEEINDQKSKLADKTKDL